MPVLFFDTETTGKANFRAPNISPEQPSLVQLGVLLEDDDGRELATIDCIIKPEDWVVPVEASNVHGIPHDLAMRAGIMLPNAIYMFRDLLYVADTIVAHNIVFDELVMDRACAMVDVAAGQPVTYPFSKRHKLICTMREATPIAKVRSKRPMHKDDYKWPSLSECSQRFFNKDIEGAHNALVDVRVCRDIYWHLKEIGGINDKTGRQAKNVYD